MITKNEILVQISLGTAETPQQIAKLVKKTTDVEALAWAIKYKNTKVRAAAVNNVALPIGLFLWACVFETSKTVRESIERIIDERNGEMIKVLNIIKHYPQISMNIDIDIDNEFTSEHS